MLELAQESSVTSVQIFSGEEPGNIINALSGESLGTLITM
jgi:isopentenyl phosphate kinase